MLAKKNLGIFALAISTALVASLPSAALADKLESILFVNPLPQYPAWRLIGDCIAKAAADAEIPMTETGPTGTLDATVMIKQIQQGIANTPGALITFPASDGFAPVLEQARDAGIIVATLYGPGGATSGAQVNIGADFAEVGEIMAKVAAEREGPQNVGLMTLGPTGVGKAFEDAFRAAAAKTSNVTVVAVVSTGDDPTKALDQANALLIAHPEINVIASHMGTATQGVSSAIRAKDLVGKVVMIANGAAAGGTEGLADGTVHKLMMQDLCKIGEQVVTSLVDIHDGKTVPEQINVGIGMFGSDGVQSHLDEGWQ
jgi:ABC-type sugar transport system substrate-binding protein